MKKNILLSLVMILAVTVGFFTVHQNVSAQTSCATIETISSNVQNAKIGDTFVCQVDVDSEFASSPNVACGLSINGGFPQNVCPSDTAFGGWQGNRALFNCTVPNFDAAISSLELVAYDFRPECGIQTGKRLALTFLNETPSRNPQPSISTTPADDTNPTPIDPDRVPSPWAKDEDDASSNSTSSDPMDKTVRPLQNLFKIIFGNFNSNPRPAPDNSTTTPPQTNPPPSSDVTPNPQTPVTPNGSFTTFRELLDYVSSKTGVPACVMEGMATMEYGSIFTYTPEEIVAGSVPGATMRNCPINSCGATGVLQLLTSRDNQGSTSCSGCPWSRTSCLDVWSETASAVNKYEGSSHIPSPCNIKDNVFAAAEKLKQNSASKGEAWTDARISYAAQRYYGACTTPVKNGKTYCQYVVDYCKL